MLLEERRYFVITIFVLVVLPSDTYGFQSEEPFQSIIVLIVVVVPVQIGPPLACAGLG